jgi:hypothetical protein
LLLSARLLLFFDVSDGNVDVDVGDEVEDEDNCLAATAALAILSGEGGPRNGCIDRRI